MAILNSGDFNGWSPEIQLRIKNYELGINTVITHNS
jgi:hypothetical protein